MNTYGYDIITQKINSMLAKYPEGSLSPREVLLTIPTDHEGSEELAQRLNFIITKQLLGQAEAFLKAHPPQPKKSFAMTALPSDISYTDKRAEAEAYKQKVTNGVLAAVNAALTSS